MGSFGLPALDIKPPAPAPNPVEQYGQLMQLKNAVQNAPLQHQALQNQVQEGQLGIQNTQQQMAARQALNAAYAGAVSKDQNGNPTFDDQKLMNGLANGPAAYQTAEVMKGITEFHKTQLDMKVTTTKLAGDQADLLGSAASAVKAANYDPAVAHSLLDSMPQTPQLQQARAAIDNPAQLKQMVDQFIANSPKQRELSAADTTAAARKLTAQTGQNKVDASMDPTSSLYAPSAASVALGTAPGAAQIQAGEAGIAAKKAGAEASARMPYEMSLAAQRQALSQGDPNMAAQLLVNKDATLSELKARGSTPDFIAKTLFAANKISGGKYNAPSADAEFSVARSPANVAFFGSAKSLTDKGGTLDQLAAAAKDIPNNQIPVFNTVADVAKAAFGNGPLAKYASILLGVSDDYSKVMGGGQGSDSSRAQALQLVPSKASPEQRAAAIEGIRGAVGSQLNSRIGANSVMQRMYGGGQPAIAPSTSGLGVRLSDAMALPQNQGKSVQQVTQDIQAHGHTVIQ